MESLFKERIHLLKSNSVIKFAFTSSFSLRVENWLFLKIIISSVYILIIPNKVPVVIIRKQGLNINIVIKSFSL
jgi:hypothetical protein